MISIKLCQTKIILMVGENIIRIFFLKKNYIVIKPPFEFVGPETKTVPLQNDTVCPWTRLESRPPIDLILCFARVGSTVHSPPQWAWALAPDRKWLDDKRPTRAGASLTLTQVAELLHDVQTTPGKREERRHGQQQQ